MDTNLDAIRALVFALNYTKTHLYYHHKSLEQDPTPNVKRFMAITSQLLAELEPLVKTPVDPYEEQD